MDQATSRARPRATTFEGIAKATGVAATAWGRRLRLHARTFLGAALLLTATAAAQADAASTTLRERLGFIGPVSQVVTEEEREDVARRLKSIDRFREDGHPEERTALLYDFGDGTLRSRVVTFFDEAGQALSRETTDASEELVAQVLFRYGETGGVVEQVTYGSDGTVVGRLTYERNATDDIVEQVTYDAQGAITARVVVEWDGDGNPVREERYRGSNLERVNVMTYGTDGALRTQETSDGDGRLRSVRQYGDERRLQEETAFDEEGEVERRSTATLDDRGNFLEIIEYDADGAVEQRATYTYDERHLLIEETFEMFTLNTPTTFVTRYAYEFDEQGNWTKRVKTEDQSGLIETSTVLETLYRSIEYHPGR